MNRPLTDDDIIAVCGRIGFDRGRRYHDEGKVLGVEWDPAEELILGTVSGSYRNRYRQEIQLTLEEEIFRFEGECTCPMEDNCKHVVAVVLEWRRKFGSPRAQTLSKKTGHSNVLFWQENLLGLLDSKKKPQHQPLPGQVLLYRLSPQIYREHTAFFLQAFKSRPLKNGRWGKATPFNLQQLTGYYYPPAWVDAGDVTIAELARQTTTPTGTAVLSGDVGALLLKRLLQSGRCFFEKEFDTPLTLGPLRGAHFSWLEEKEGGRRLRLDLEGCTDSCLPIPTDPPWYLDPLSHQCGPIAQDLAPELFHALCHLPPLDKGELTPFSQFLSLNLPPDALPLPVPLDYAVWDDPPMPVLQLRGQIGPKGNLIHVARSGFAYGPCLLSPCAEDAPSQEVVRLGEGEWLIRRDLAEEASRLEKLLAFGLVPASLAGVGEPGEWDLVITAETAAGSAARWRHLLQALPQLEADGWRIERDESFKLNFMTAGEVTAVIDESEDTGWFDIGLDIEFQGRTVPLLPLLTQWLEEGESEEPLFVDIGAGSWLEVPRSVLKPIVGTLLELYQKQSVGENGQLRLPRQQAPLLQVLEEQLCREGGRLRWQGGAKIRRLAEELRNFQGIEAVPAPFGLCATLRPYQERGLAWLQFLRGYGFGGILADDMGLGKTVQTLAHLLVELEAGRLERPALVVAPTSVLSNWQSEAARFAPGLRVLVLHGSKRAEHFAALEGYHLVITSYALLPRDVATLVSISWHSVILDEAQYIKNPKSRAAQAASALPAANRLCLTGTPLENHLGELWSLFHFLMPGFLGQETAFNTLFRYPIEKRGVGGRRQQLVRRIAPFILRRDKGQVATELPSKTEIIQSVEFDSAQRRLYESIRVAMADKIGRLLKAKGLARSHIEMLDALLKLRQVCCDPRLVKLESARKVKESAKLQVLMEMLEELMDEGRKVLIFSQFASMLVLIEEELQLRHIQYSKLTGQTRKRDDAIAAFQSGEVPVFLVSLKAGGVGLNLTAADTVIHYDPWWNPAVENQATDRAYRIGQDKPVFVYKLVAANTVEEKILQLQQRKQALAGDIYQKRQGEEDNVSGLRAEDFLGLFDG